MIKLNGRATDSVKQGYEAQRFIFTTLPQLVGELICGDAASSDVYTPNASFVPIANTSGLAVAPNFPIQSLVDNVLTIVGTDQDDQTLTATVTVKAQDPEGQAYLVIPSDETKFFKTVTSVSPSVHTQGDGIDLFQLPDLVTNKAAAYVPFDLDMDLMVGKEVLAIPSKYNPTEQIKRNRGERTLNYSCRYTNNRGGIAKFANRSICLIQEIHENGSNVASETWIVTEARMSNPRNSPDTADLSQKGEGFWKKVLIFS